MGGAHRAPQEIAATLKEYLLRQLRELREFSPDQLLENRYNKYRKMGLFRDNQSVISETASEAL